MRGPLNVKHVMYVFYNPYKRTNINKRRVQKRPNFLNSAPTSTESPLRPLSAPSVTFWQQTAICPVSLWTLDVELQPLNSARAQAVRRIGDKVTMKELEEQRVCVWHFDCNINCIVIAFRLEPQIV